MFYKVGNPPNCMAFKDPEKRRAYRRKWYSENKESEKAHISGRKKELRNWFWEYKKKLKCIECGEDHPITLEFHHKIPHTKERMISKMLTDGLSIKKILIEMEKCEVLCANCHRKKHHNNFKNPFKLGKLSTGSSVVE